jgi:Cys-rich repeat protein
MRGLDLALPAGMNAYAYVIVGIFGIGLAGACAGSSSTNVGGAGSGLCASSCGSRQCDPTLGCVDCTSDAQCGGGDKFCITGKCEACRTNADCGVSAPACWPGDHQCHASCAVAGAQACPGNARICDQPSGQCVGCKAATDCAAPNAVCSAVSGQCVQCAINTDCPASAPTCLATGRCAQCLSNADCGGSTPICDTEELKCRAGCTSDAMCAAPHPRCDTHAGSCVQCSTGADCSTAAPLCNPDGACTLCLVDKDCMGTPSTPYCRSAQACVQCLTKDQCTGGQKCQDGACR